MNVFGFGELGDLLDPPQKMLIATQGPRYALSGLPRDHGHTVYYDESRMVRMLMQRGWCRETSARMASSARRPTTRRRRPSLPSIKVSRPSQAQSLSAHSGTKQ